MWSHLSRIRGGIGLRGPGETQLETDRRLIGRRIARLKQELREMGTATGGPPGISQRDRSRFLQGLDQLVQLDRFRVGAQPRAEPAPRFGGRDLQLRLNAAIAAAVTWGCLAMIAITALKRLEVK